MPRYVYWLANALGLQRLQILTHYSSKYYEERMFAVICLAYSYPTNPENVAQFYLGCTPQLGCWALVDASAYQILGEYLLDRDREVLYRLIGSSHWWERRIALVATLAFVRIGDRDTFDLAERCLDDKHRLILLGGCRRIGKHSYRCLEGFIKVHGRKMSGAMLRSSTRLCPEMRAGGSHPVGTSPQA